MRNLWLLILVLMAPHALAAILQGSVDEVRDDGIVILVIGKNVPVAGDRATVSYQGFDGPAQTLGVWRVDSVSGGRATASRVEGEGVPAGGESVRIDSAKPGQRQLLPGEDPWFDSLADAQGLTIGNLDPRFDFDDPASEAGEGDGGRAGQTSAGQEATAAAGPIDPAAPDIAALIARWIQMAQPPQNADPAVNLRYTDWGQLVGQAKGGVITANAKPDDAVGMTSPVFLWQRRPNLPSLTHCTLRVFVEKSVAGDSLDDCSAGSAQGGGSVASAGNAPVQSTEQEPNDSFAQAGTIAPNGSVNGRIEKRNDADWYRVRVGHQGELSIAFVNAPPEVDLAVRVAYTDNRTLLNWQTAKGNGGLLETFADLPAAGEYLLEVRDSYNNAFSEQGYRLQTLFTPTADVAEPNATIASASELGPNGSVRGNILPRNDADWYKVSVDHQGQLELNIDQAPAELDMAIRVAYADNRTLLNWATAKSKGTSLATFADLPAPGDYYLEVRDSYNNARSASPYRLTTRFAATSDSDEPNNSLAEAQAIGTGARLRANILPLNDADWYRIKVDHQGELRINFDQAPSEVDMAVRVAYPDNRTLLSWAVAKKAGEPLATIADLPAPGEYYLEVRDSYNNARSIEPYRLSTVFTATADGAEPNNQLADASTLAVPGSVNANILPRNDADWYRIKVNHQGELKLDFGPVPAEVDMAVRVAYPDNRTLRNWAVAKKNGEKLSVIADLATPGEYYLEVRDSYNNSRSIAPYLLATSFITTADRSEPDDSIQQAQPLAMGSSVRANILPRGDVDWYRVSLPAGTLRVSMQGPAELDMTARLADGSNRTVGNWQTAKTAGGKLDGKFKVPAAGSYYLEVRDSYNNARSAQPYGLKVWME